MDLKHISLLTKIEPELARPLIFCFLNLSLTLLMVQLPASAQSSNKQASAVELTKILDSSGILQSGYRCSVALDSNNSATVASYQNLSSKNLDSDCKIDSVLLAKKLFDSRTSLNRVKVKFIDPRGSGNAKIVTVTVGDVLAYSSGKVKMQSLLSSLEIVNVNENKAAAKALTPAKASNHSGSTSSGGLMSPADAADLMKNYSSYQNLKASIAIPYPRHWKVYEHPEAGTEVAISGLNKSGQVAEMRLRVNNAQVQTVEELARIVRNSYSQSKDFNELDERQETFGSHRNLSGLRKTFAFREPATGVLIIQQNIFFSFAGKLSWLYLGCVGWNQEDSALLFNEILSKIDSLG